MIKKIYRPWKHTELVAGLVVRHFRKPNLALVLGPKLTGVVAGLLMPMGGHIQEEDLGPITACQREIAEEGNLRPKNGRRVAELRVKITEPRLKIKVHIILFTEWTGRLKNLTEEFQWLKFIKYSEIPWNQMPPKEQKWFDEVLVQNKRRLVHITCGKNRKDTIRLRTSPLR